MHVVAKQIVLSNCTGTELVYISLYINILSRPTSGALVVQET